MSQRNIPGLRLRAAIALLGAGLLAATGAAAQGMLEEVTVTAQKREQNPQDVGIAITTFSGEQLESLGMYDTADVANHTPGLMFTRPSSSNILGLPSVRGVSQNDFQPHQETPIALYIDESYFSFIGGNVASMFDTERVEVLKGPQGTLFGRNATGGLMHAVSRKPGQELDGYLSYTLGEYSQHRVQGAVGGPISDTVAVRVSGLYSKHDGWVKNNIGSDNYEDDTMGGRVHLQFTPSDDLEVLLSWWGSSTDDIVVSGNQHRAAFLNPDGLGAFVPSNVNYYGTCNGCDLFGYRDEDGDAFKGSYNRDGSLDSSTDSFSARITYDFAGMTLTSITNATRFDIDWLEDNDLSPNDVTVYVFGQDADQFSQELRLSGSGDRMRWVAGLYYLEIDGENFNSFEIIPFAADHQTDWDLQTESYAAFGQLEYDLSEALTLIVGARWTEEDKDVDMRASCAGGGCSMVFPPVPGTLNDIGRYLGSQSDGDWSGKLQLDWRIAEGMLGYASITRGIKAGGYNAPLDGLLNAQQLPYDGETLLSYEVGLKTMLWDDKARLNLSAFYYDYSDHQAFDLRGITSVIANNDATSQGLEAEFIWSPGMGIELMLGMSLLDAEVEDVSLPSGRVIDAKPPQAPETTFNAMIAKEWVLSPGIVRAQFDMSYVDEYYVAVSNAPVTKVPDYTVSNVRASFRAPDDRYEVAFTVKNVFDDENQSYAFDIASLGFAELTYLPPRWMAAEFTWRF
jgi:iron complex outermembrane recepter protein